MTNIDQKTFFTALGFLAVILNDVPNDKQAQRAAAIAELIESFCATSVSSTDSKPTTKELLDNYVKELQATGSARLSHDRKTLLDMYEILLAEKVWHDQREFFASGHEDMIANRILQLVEEKMQWGQQL